MNISLNTTHKLPFYNATITAKQLSDSTTPVQFRTFTGDDIGYSILTNARGFLCESNGTPYVDGVFVAENAIVTATLGDGSSTSWTVGAQLDISVYDGILFGRELNPGEDDTNSVLIGAKRYKKLFSANQSGNSQLSLYDLADIPSFTKWTDDQQIEFVNFGVNKETMLLGIQTKTVILLPLAGTTPPLYPKSHTIYLQATLNQDGKTRFGRNFTVTNNTDARIVLANAEFPNEVIGGVNAGCSISIAETYPNAPIGSDLGGAAKFIATDNGNLVNPSGVTYLVGTADIIVINDATPDTLYLSEIHNKSENDLHIRVDATANTQSRRIILVRGDEQKHTIHLVDKKSGAYIGAMRPYDSMELVIYNNVARAVSSCLNRISSQALKITGVDMGIPAGVEAVSVELTDCTDVSTTYKLYFDRRGVSYTRIDFTGNTVPVWIQPVACTSFDLQSYQSKYSKFCVPAGGGCVCIRTISGIIQIIEKSWVPFSQVSYPSDRTFLAVSTSMDVNLDIGQINAMVGRAFASNSDDGPTNRLQIKLPIAPNTTTRLRINMENYSSSVKNENGVARIQLLGSDGTMLIENAQTSILSGSSNWQDEQTNFVFSAQIVEGMLTHTGNSGAFVLVDRYQKQAL